MSMELPWCLPVCDISVINVSRYLADRQGENQKIPMDVLSKFRVVLSGRVVAGHQRQDVVNSLARLFRSSAIKIERLLSTEQTTLKKEYSKSEAEKICKAIRDAGAECRLQEVPKMHLELVEDQLEPEKPVDDTMWISCRRCNSRQQDGREQCINCGEPLSIMADHQPSETSPIHDRHQSSDRVSSNKERLNQAMMRFVGPNADLYAARFSAFGSILNPSYSLTWHWPALLVFFFWALYRKMWVLAAINLIGQFALMYFLVPTIPSIIWALAWPLSANYLYFRHVRARVMEMDDDQIADSGVPVNGGVSQAAVFIGIAIVLVSNLLFGQAMLTRIVGDQIGDLDAIMPGGSSQYRGDGSMLTPDGLANPKVTRTLLTMSTQTMAIKLTAVAFNQGDDEQVLEMINGHLKRTSSKDAWGTPLTIDNQQNNLVLVSAGPDRVYNTEDDLLQDINLSLK